MTISIFTAGGGLLGSALGSLVNQHPKDKIRFARNADIANRAANGDKIAFWHLGVLSRRVAAPAKFTFGPYNDGWTGTVPAGAKWDGSKWGWATSAAADDAWNKYQQLAALYGNSTQSGGTGAGIGTQTIPNVPTIGNGVAQNGNADNGTGTTPQGFTAASLLPNAQTLPLFIAGGIVIGLLAHYGKLKV